MPGLVRAQSRRDTMITQRFRPIGWVVGIAVAIMLLYVIQLQVANERGKLNEVDTQIAMLRKDIRRLNTEFNTRASMRQLERWNSADDQLALAAPQARQFVKAKIAFRKWAMNALKVMVWPRRQP
jgi:hypothetical protein